MRLLHVVPTYFPAVRYGGPLYSVHGLGVGLAGLGHDVQVYTTSVDGSRDSDVAHGCPTERDGLRVTYFRSPGLRRVYWAPALKTRLRETVSEFDVVHLHSVFLWPTLVAARMAERANVPFVLSPRGMLVPELIERKGRWAKRAWIRCFERHTVSAASAVHVTSALERDDLLEMGLAPERVEVVPNGIDDPRFPIEPNRRVTQGRLLYLGRISWKKGIDRLIHAMASIAHADLCIAGGDDEHLVPRLKQLAVDVGVEKRVRFIGPVGGVGKERLFAETDLLVLPSISENFGNVVLEAMVRARPVVVTRGVGLAAVVEDAGCGIVVDGDPESLAVRINALLADPSRRAEMGEAGRARALREFTWDRVAPRMESLYRSVLNSRA